MREPFRLVTAVVIAVGLALGTYHATDRAGLCWFFTFQVCTAQMVLSVVGDARRWGVLRTAVVVYLLVAGLAFALVLANPWSGYAMGGTAETRGWTVGLSNLLLHVVAPPLALIGWLRARPVLASRRRFLLLVSAYPLVYLSALLTTGRYPYSFIDVPKIGYPEALRNAAVLAVVTVVIGLLALRSTRATAPERAPERRWRRRR